MKDLNAVPKLTCASFSIDYFGSCHMSSASNIKMSGRSLFHELVCCISSLPKRPHRRNIFASQNENKGLWFVFKTLEASNHRRPRSARETSGGPCARDNHRLPGPGTY